VTKKDPHAAALGRKGGKSTAKKMTAKQRSEAARRAAEIRWERYRILKQGKP